MSYYFAWRPYVPVAEKRRLASRKLAKLRKRGQSLDPVAIEGRTIAKTFWGNRGVATWSGTATIKTGCRAAAATSGMAPSSICKSRKARPRPWLPGQSSTGSRSALRQFREPAGNPSVGIAQEQLIPWSSCCRAV